jgi:membrane protease YdiL (CAAX protease family)
MYTNSLWFVIGFHFSWNLAQSLLGLWGSDSFYGILNLEFAERNRLNGMEYGFESSCICTIIVLLSALLAAAYRKKLQRGNLA